MIYLNHLLEATGGILRWPGSHTHFSAFSHDTRQLAPGELFVAVRGARGDGHDYLLDALRLGASGLLVEAERLNAMTESIQAALAESEAAVVVVEDTRQALQDYARFILAHWHPTVIAVTGSVGKTITKETIASVLAGRYRTFRSWQNYNDLLGIPLSLGRLTEQHEYAVLELGGDHPGEIAALCRIVRPSIGVLTAINPVQLRYFGRLQRLAEEFWELFRSLPEDGQFFYNQDDPAIQALIAQYRTAPRAGAALREFMPPIIGATEATRADITYMGWDGIVGVLPPEEAEEPGKDAQPVRLRSRLLGEHHFAAMLAAYRVARSQGMHRSEIVREMEQVAPLPGRLNPLPGVYRTRLLDDTHNAAPASVIAGLKTLHVLTPRPAIRIAVLGDMLNLGDYAEEAHRQVGAQAASLADYLVVRGEYAVILAEAARTAGLAATRIIITSTHEDAARAVRHLLAEHEEAQRDEQAYQAPYNTVLIKGSEETRMERVTELLMARTWEAPEKLVRQAPGWKKTIFRRADRPTWVEIDLNAIGKNTRLLKERVGPRVRLLASLKADAYGHGAVKVARTVLLNGASMLGVATVSEAIPLREAGIAAPILVFGYVPRWQMREAVRLDVTVTLYAGEMAQELSRAALELEKTVRVHVKVDTGMGRLGIRAEQIDEIVRLVRMIRDLPGLVLEGIYTHFATADEKDQTYARLQLERFQQVLRALDGQALRPPIVHAANSAALLSLPEAHFDMVRPGIAIYGLNPSPDVCLPPEFRAALSFKTQVSQVKMIPAGEGISYGHTYVTERPTRIAVLPVGYADGFRRSPRNWGSVLIHGQEAPIVGRVCMDQCMVDITHIPQTRIGDEVVLIGRQGEAVLSAETVAERLGTINYEVVSEILARVPRVD
ncbi:MAG: alanine racemase [Ktedonobacteraceae bacterium]|nr:alanine racemase [Ktedonobacteraceae bacterium]